jgi:hypothetical protein
VWPPRLPGLIFYLVLNEEYAAKIARDWNFPYSGAWYVTRFHKKTPISGTHRIDVTATEK